MAKSSLPAAQTQKGQPKPTVVKHGRTNPQTTKLSPSWIARLAGKK